jgi:hypothetical protein
MNLLLDVLLLRRLRIEYISPPICPPAITSGSSASAAPILIEAISPLTAPSARCDAGILKWADYPGQICASLYRVSDNTYTLVQECVQGTAGFVLPDDACYAISIITDDGLSPFSNTICACGVGPTPPPLDPPVAFCDNGTLRWNAYPGQVCASLYHVVSGVYNLLQDCVVTTGFVVPDAQSYAVTVTTAAGTSPFSNVISDCIAEFFNTAADFVTPCAGGLDVGMPACVHVNAGVYSSLSSQEDADSKATAVGEALLGTLSPGPCCNAGPTKIQDIGWTSGGGGSPPEDTTAVVSVVGNPSGTASGFARQDPGGPGASSPWIANIRWQANEWCSVWPDYTATVSFDWSTDVGGGFGDPSATYGWLIDYNNGTIFQDSLLENSSGHVDVSFVIVGNGPHDLSMEFIAGKAAPTNSPGSPQITITNLTFRPLVPPVTKNCTIVSTQNPPPNDGFSNAQLITGSSGSVTGSNVFATVEPGEPTTEAGAPVKNSVWYSWTAPANGTAHFNTCGSNYDTVLVCYTGVAVNALTLIAANDDGTCPPQSNISFAATSGTTYHIRVDGFNGSQGSIILNWSLT